MSRIGAAAVAVAAAVTAAVATAWASGGGAVDVAWVPALELALHFELDGLAALYALIAAGVGLAVLVYSLGYLPRHLQHQGRDAREQPRFYVFLVLFMLAMIGLACAQDLILLFVFWDLTAITSYYLIGYDRHEAEPRRAALMTLVVTGVSAVLLLIAILVLQSSYGSFSLPELEEAAGPGTSLTLAGVLIVVAAAAKSAQFPLHFWLPRAMAAPTPVSAYLHSAAMVAAGVLLVGRTYPLLSQSQVVLDLLLVIGTASIVVGGLLALTAEGLKRLLAYSTISQYGYVSCLYGLGGDKAAGAAALYVLAHAVAKSALFMTAGAVTEATGGREQLSELGGLARRLPLVAAASAIAIASVVALPLSIGFFADEAVFGAAVEHGTVVSVAAVAAAALTFAYLGRFWVGIFLGSSVDCRERIPGAMKWPLAALALVLLAGGVAPTPFTSLAEAAGGATLAGPDPSLPHSYHLDTRSENVMALAAYALGLLLLTAAMHGTRVLERLQAAAGKAGPERLYELLVSGLNALSERIHDFEVRDLRTRVAAALVPGGVLAAIGIAASSGAGYSAGVIRTEDTAAVLALAAVATTSLLVVMPRRHLPLMLSLSAVGFSLAALYAFLGAPDVALVAVLVETVFALLFVGAFALLPPEVLRREADLEQRKSHAGRDAGIGLLAGGAVFALVWTTLSSTTDAPAVADEHLKRAEEIHADDVVTGILTDFRGLDTAGEVSVVVVALLGIVTLLRRGRLW